MGRILALDVGDVWTGTALSDDLGLLARPNQTIKTINLETYLERFFADNVIDKVVVGYPRTMRGTVSEQTKKVMLLKDELEGKFSGVSWILWDERLSSKRAQSQKSKRLKIDKQHEHSLAAAFILDSYLEYNRIYNLQ